MDTQDMLLTIIKIAEDHGQYDGYGELELEYQDIIKKAKDFNKKLNEICDQLKKEGLL